jgi:hypothetical protein
MRLARTATPLPRRSGRLESNQRSPVPDTGGVAFSPTTRCNKTPGGTRTRASGLRARRHRRFDHGGVLIGGPGVEPGPARYQRAVPPRTLTSEGSGGRDRTCLSRLTVARLADSTTPERMRRRQQDSNLRTGNSRLRVSNALPYHSAIPPRTEGEGVEPPRPRGPPVFETGYRADGSPSEGGPGRLRTCTQPIKNRQLCRLSYGASAKRSSARRTGGGVWGNREVPPAALATLQRGRQESNLRRVALQATALPT